jgi:hypothetical protein
LSCVMAGRGGPRGRDREPGRPIRGGDVAEAAVMGACYAPGLLAEDLGKSVLNGRKGAVYGAFSSIRHESSAKVPAIFV